MYSSACRPKVSRLKICLDTFKNLKTEIHNISIPILITIKLIVYLPPSVSMYIGQGLSLEARRAAQAERRAANTGTAAAPVAAAAAAASTPAAAAAAATESASSASSPIMASTSPPTSPKCPVLPDGRAITAAFVGMDKDRFSSMFADDVQILCVSGSDCKIHPDAGPVDESFHRCMNCALKFHSCINCSGVRFADWISAASAREMLSQYRQEKFDCYKDDFSLSLLELCSYCQKSIALSTDVGRSCGAAVITDTAVPASTAAGDVMGALRSIIRRIIIR